MNRILVVEDEKSMRDLLALMLRKEGYDVDTAESAVEARRRMEAGRDGAPDLLISDISMPGMSGLELLRFARKGAPETAVILMTAYGSKETAIEALNDGALYYVEKPFDLDEVKAVVRKTMEQKRLAAENEALRVQNRGLRAELEEKYRLRITLRPWALMLARLPVKYCEINVKRRTREQRLRLVYNLLSKKFEPLACEACGADTFQMGFCDERMHLLCAACLDKSRGKGSKDCPRCQGKMGPKKLEQVEGVLQIGARRAHAS